ncbi:chorismate transformation enzyme, FkbO/Hyg5 family [Cupriavidus basilensis]
MVDFRTDATLGLIFGSVTLREADFAAAQEACCSRRPSAPISTSSACWMQKGYPYLVRVWNYVADINAEESGMERYRQFNIGRQDAFTACRREIVGNVPAACALGAVGQPVAQRTLSIGFLASPRAPVAVENPRQVSAYHYPAQYGPRSPTFARAGVWRAGTHDECAAPVLFVSGTASIVGHRTVHAGDVAAQTRESIANVAAVLEQAARDGHAEIGLSELAYRVYRAPSAGTRHPRQRARGTGGRGRARRGGRLCAGRHLPRRSPGGNRGIGRPSGWKCWRERDDMTLHAAGRRHGLDPIFAESAIRAQSAGMRASVEVA